MNRRTIVLSRHEKPDERAAAIERGLVERCRNEGVVCLTVPPIYHIPESSVAWRRLAGDLDGAVLLCWLHPRPVHWLLRRHAIDLDPRRILDLHEFSDVEAAWAATMKVATGTKSANQPRENQKPYRKTSKPRWYPVIDGSRCVQCRHCLQFCLFGVYGLDANDRVIVKNPDRCKPGCPACARICPQSAIMFPLYENDAAIAGAPGQFVVLDAAAQKMFSDRVPQPERLPFDDLDALVDELDHSMRRRQ